METTAKKNYRSHKRAIRTRNAVIYVFLIVLSIVWLVPFLYLFFQSFSSSFSAKYFAPLLPTAKNIEGGYPVWTFDNYIKLFNSPYYHFGNWYLNTLIISAVSCIIETVMVLGTSYAFSRLRFQMRKPLMKLILLLGMFPGFLSMLIIYFILKLIGLGGNVFSLILIYIGGSAMQYYIAKGFFDTIPKSLDEAAMIDGANKNTIFFKVIMPLSKPIIVYTLLITFTAPWGDFMLPSYLAGGTDTARTVAVGMQKMITTLETKAEYFTVFCAGGVFVSIPIMILFFWLQKYYVEGITGGAVKG
ncbi:MAG: ABC transporter permease subunit [Candidatus Enterosoma sp.]|nr:ABC transporter permease subunit [Bacilli bacterium]MDD7180945.1 ABC transporter permease subunit [Bacilli bacterium]MDY3046860.1 ABC transporter permease subunit [Candidatus Enterosoma sp.]